MNTKGSMNNFVMGIKHHKDKWRSYLWDLPLESIW